MIALQFALAGFALLLTQQAAMAVRKITAEFTELGHATKIFPHPNETTKPYQKRKP